MAVTYHGTQSGELVINWHVTEACNYRCRYCYSKWHAEGSRKELIHSPKASAAMLAEIYRHFSPDNRLNQARLGMQWDSVRLSLAGGEPLLYSREIVGIVAQARELGFKVSLITNGSRLTQPLMTELAPQLSILGLSFDSAIASTNREIGRADRHEQILSLSDLAIVIESGRHLNPALRMKINTVVNALNFTEDMSQLIQQLAPDKWKVLRMLPTITSDLAIADHEFAEFVTRHKRLGVIMAAEDNNDMVESYIMIDPHGRFFQNSSRGTGYHYSDEILKVGAETAFREIGWQPDKFRFRYRTSVSETIA
ncbi:radical SAM protein [Dechloromonas denitrificans]|uniref:S-adenosylmethionine-dependent nucleotide dehydratase n=1 Tax=Dechloromonas denitrificans TaxID=281362 RepID=A0A133XFV2_9RHOO|nr:viperin family antiviral radical SAM protein [Dechloromonas denitrificans]KXB29821.1 radical SAM protein [Dechloromonas denitrificans]